MDIPERSDLNPKIEEEIKMLEQKLAEKKREAGIEAPEPKKERELFREVVREHAAEVAPSTVPGPSVSPTIGTPQASAPVSEQEKQERENTMTKLIETALTHGIMHALKSPEAENFYYVDELHDRLADEYYDKLVQLRKIKPVT
jgi:hypothetical protein